MAFVTDLGTLATLQLLGDGLCVSEGFITVRSWTEATSRRGDLFRSCFQRVQSTMPGREPAEEQGSSHGGWGQGNPSDLFPPATLPVFCQLPILPPHGDSAKWLIHSLGQGPQHLNLSGRALRNVQSELY